MTFDDITADMLPLVGGKALNLGVMTRAGLPVPPGACLTTEAYRRVAGRARLEEVLDRLAGTPADDVAALAGLAARARELVASAPVPDDIADVVRRLADGPVAVRSSATAEDLPHASFAGQQDTVLNVVGPDAVLEAVRRCWASLWTDRAVAYRAANRIDHRAVRLAVVIQRMVDAEVAGVMFTADPVTGTRRQTVIDAAPGLGESVVSGSVDPDRFVVAPDGRITERRPGGGGVAVRAVAGGGTEHIARHSAPRIAGHVEGHIEGHIEGHTEGHTAPDGEVCLTDDQVLRLAELGARVEEHYGAPQDTEWAIDADGRLWLTQARPITTLYPQPESELARRDPGGLRVYFCFSLAQGLHRPITPMGVAATRLIATSMAEFVGLRLADRTAGPPIIAEAGQRLFFDLTLVVRSRMGRIIAPVVLDLMEKRSAVVLRRLFDDPRLSVTLPRRGPVVRGMLRVAVRNHIPPRLIHSLIEPASAYRQADRMRAWLSRRSALPGGATAAERLDHVEDLLTHVMGAMVPVLFPGAAAGGLALALATRLLRGHVRPGEITSVLRGLPHNVTTEMDLALWEAATCVRADEESARLVAETPPEELARRRGSLPAVLERELDGFLSAYGHRAVAEIDLGMPRWSDDPTQVLGVIANYLRLDDPALAPDAVFLRGAKEAEAMIEELARRVGGARGRVVRWALRRARLLVGLREMPKNIIILAFAAARQQLQAVGAELAAHGRIERADDVFFLTFAEARAAVRDGADRRALVAERRASYERELYRRHVPRLLLSDGTEPEAVATAPAGGAITGTPASAGTVTGPARVVLDPVGAHLEPGEILVAPSTDPGWTPLFLTAGGLIMEMGGSNSHGAVVAREYGIPAVVGVPEATQRIATGQIITVDGTSGAITIADVEADGEAEEK
ncbi:PEP/pyruvate-binding domain-containing protein [Thermopolyspora sp. NPDC052614]|uniref:PEP/pyruvate-binding domain-containing protein n=1 Tax=Thermopolyspora sp. NPDC052614 TaxID=3155682 RepID=UPI003425D6C4